MASIVQVTLSVTIPTRKRQPSVLEQLATLPAKYLPTMSQTEWLYQQVQLAIHPHKRKKLLPNMEQLILLEQCFLDYYTNCGANTQLPLSCPAFLVVHLSLLELPNETNDSAV